MKLSLKIIAPLLIIVLAFVGYKILGSMRPAPKSQVPPPVVPLVEQIFVSPEDHAPPVRSFGIVESFFETNLTSQVSGQILEVSEKFRVGETVKVGHVLVKIDPTDYVAALAREESNLTIAERSFAEEEIRAAQAAGDWEASGRKLENATDFVLRKPQLAAARSSIESAKAAIEKARADLERTEVRAPFDAVITARQASPGNQASSQTSLGSLVSTEKVEIRLPLMAEQLARVSIPSDVQLTSPLKPGVSWQAKLVRMEPSVDRQNQVMYAVAEVEQPFADEAKSLSIGIFANASIDAKHVPDSYQVPEAAYVSDHFVWVIDSKNQLKRLEAERLMNFEGQIFLKPVQEDLGELRVVTRPLSNFKEGMKVKTSMAIPEEP
jgi:RND family efflux transporter MFP subunit